MKGAWVLEKQKVTMVDMEMPVVTDDTVIVKIMAAGVCGSDIGMYHGTHPFRNPPSMLGHEMSGVITEVGARVTKFKVGDKVAFNPIVNCGECYFCKHDAGNVCPTRQIAGADGSSVQGTFAEYIKVPETHLSLLEEHVPYDVAALVEPLSVAQHALKLFRGRKESILVYGTGVIGLCTVLLARELGFKRIYCLNRREFKRNVALELGADAAWNPEEIDVVKTIRELEPEGVDAVMLSVSNEKIMDIVLGVLAIRGEVCYAYQNTAKVPFNFCPLVNNEFTIFGTTGETMEDFQECADFVNKYTDRCAKLITHVYPMSQADKAVEMMADAAAPAIKVLVHPQEA